VEINDNTTGWAKLNDATSHFYLYK